MTWTPEFKLYDSTGLTLLYTFPAVYATNAPQTVEEFVEHTNIRSTGSIIVDGGTAPWDLTMNFTIIGDDYQEIASAIDTLENTVLFNTAYILKIDKAPGQVYEYKVKRLSAFSYPESLRNSYQRVNARFRVNSW